MTQVLSPDETRRYARHLVLKGVGGSGQQRIKAAKVLVIGAGGLGSPVVAYLGAAGVGTIGIIDDDAVAISNLQRQVIHSVDQVGRPKTESAKDFLAALNPHVAVKTYEDRFAHSNAQDIVRDYDILIDGSDNFATRVISADASEQLSKPLVFGAVSMFDGQVTVFLPGPDHPKFRDLYPVHPSQDDLPSCEATGVIGALTGVIGTLMAMEAIKLITGVGESLVGRLLVYNGKDARFNELRYG
ncbi:HesA/MoeB/ThiF family protein [Devosia naphthalenivorans]|uniref:HesA/MoeB/ThiF family protein n=1 Tax=Devosia naphthalenivorans TaxID=2082392 RepID=UPI000D3D779E|nr:molybdopterin-synthase adenylyltransferase MoeB [Devosia naphthalenivorans]